MSCSDCSCTPEKLGPCMSSDGDTFGVEPCPAPTYIPFDQPEAPAPVTLEELIPAFSAYIDVIRMLEATGCDMKITPEYMSLNTARDAIWFELAQLALVKKADDEEIDALTKTIKNLSADLVDAQEDYQDALEDQQKMVSQIVELKRDIEQLTKDNDAANAALRMVDAARMLREMFPEESEGSSV